MDSPKIKGPPECFLGCLRSLHRAARGARLDGGEPFAEGALALASTEGVHRMRVLAAFFAAVLLPLAAYADTQRGTMTVSFKYQSVTVKQVEDFDGTWDHTTAIDQSAVMTCPVSNDGIAPTSYLDGLNPDQKAAQDKLGQATTADLNQMQQDGTAARMQAMEAAMKACKATGRSEQVCAMEAVQKMQSDPAFLDGVGKMGQNTRKAEPGVAAAAGRFEIWYSENCTGTLTANNRTTLSKGSVVKTVETIVGKRPLSNADANVVVETDMTTTSTRMWIVTPEASGLLRTAPDQKPQATVAALPDGNVIAGPTPGGIKSGRLSKKTPGGGYTVEWVFARQK